MAPSAKRRVASVLAALALALLPSSCRLTGTEKHLAPLYTRLSVATPAPEDVRAEDEIEAVGGMVLVKRNAPELEAKEWMLRPLIDWRSLGPESSERTVLFPFGLSRKTPIESVGQFLPLFRYQENYNEQGLVETYSFLTILGIYWAHFGDGRDVRAWFPFAGSLEHAFTFDHLEFILFPLYARSERVGRHKLHLLFPIFSTSWGSGGRDGRLWPLFGRSKYEGRHDRWFFLWPFFHYHRNNLFAPHPELHETKWMFLPLYGKTKVGTFTSHSVLWPFFGWSHDTESGFRAWDGPWPLVRVQRPGESEQAERTRFWPLYSRYAGDGLTSTYYGWPLHAVRKEDYPESERNSRYFIPFWQSWRRRAKTEEAVETRFQKLWPLYQRHKGEQSTRTAFPALSPLWFYPEFEKRWAYLWELWSREEGRNSETVRERSWLGLWRREKDAFEDRRSLSGLWARRKYRREDGAKVRETSLLFGLLRWRSVEGTGLDLLPPSLPGPGWPKERVETRLDLRPL